MIARIHKSMREKDQGFTLIELLVVMIIIGILAAIAIPVFLSQREKARDTSTKADLSTVGKEIAAYYVEPIGDLVVTANATTVTLTNGTNVSTVDISEGTVFDATTTYTPAQSTTWCVDAINTNGDVQDYSYAANAGLTPNDVC
ncbi:type II secretion system protein [Actinotalea sp. Marseille-Q4924]|uniref:type II secretion system protein n=1 Tax=Actinotalea sp. Marseille-Q4924 TaxID=2866571 RepID=UPI0027155A93|nr:prepilin-type N-terminal cleavage/methylation domain-containing protein [Actinotalea sp. Marseille-Q4924]